MEKGKRSLVSDRVAPGRVFRRGVEDNGPRSGWRDRVALDGRIALGEESNALREKLKSLIGEGKKKIVPNMDNITYIDSAGLGILVAAHCSAKTQGASLLLCHLGSKFKEVLQISKLLTVFEVCDTEAAAVASFSR